MTQKIRGKFYPLQHEEWMRACKELTSAERDILYYIRTLDPRNNSIDVSAAALARDLSTPERKVYRQTISRALKVLAQKGLIDEKYGIVKRSSTIERQICARLNKKLGGLTEVPTPVGRIDLLTDSEIIEVKEVNDWKCAIGQVMAYSGFYPEHRKHIHLFGRNGKMIGITAVTICLELDIILRFEEVAR